MKLILPFFSELWVFPKSKPIGRAFLSDLKVKIVEAFNLKTGGSRKCNSLFLRGDEISLAEFVSGSVRVRFVASGPGSKLFHLVRYFSSFDRVIWLGARCRVQTAVSPYYEDLVKFAQLGHKTKGCPVTNFRVHFDLRVPEIQVSGGEGWIRLHSSADLLYSVPSGLSYRPFAKLRHDQIAAGLRDPIVPQVSTPPGESTSEEPGGVQHGPSRTSTPGNFY